VVTLAIDALIFGGLPALVAVGAGRRRSGDPTGHGDALLDDLAELDALHQRGLLTDEERQTAIERRLRGAFSPQDVVIVRCLSATCRIIRPTPPSNRRVDLGDAYPGMDAESSSSAGFS
jgi:hypothetical protein